MYIRGKTSISLLVASINAAIYWAVGLDLWLAFGVLAFFLNFIPNIGMFTSVVLPMPLIALDPQFSPLLIAFSFLGPLTVGSIAKDVLEPLVLGRSTSLHPVAVLLTILIYGSVWGVSKHPCAPSEGGAAQIPHSPQAHRVPPIPARAMHALLCLPRTRTRAHSCCARTDRTAPAA